MSERPNLKPKGSCVISVRLQSHAEYLKWKTYVDPGRKWEFEVSFPAIIRMNFEFKDSMDIEMLSKKVIWLLQLGFDVYSAQWKLDKNAMNTTP